MNRNLYFLISSNQKKIVLGVLLLVLALILSACGVVEQEVTLAKDEKWSAETRLTLDQQTLALINPADIEQKLEAAKADMSSIDVSYKWKKHTNDDGSLTYTINTSGTGYNVLNTAVFDGGASIQTIDEDGTTEFSYTAIGDFSDYALVLHVGEVIETNGVVSDKGEVSWRGMGTQMYARIKPKSGMDIKWLLLVGGGIVLIALAAYFAFFRSRTTSNNRYASYATSYHSASGRKLKIDSGAYCQRCGGKLNPNGTFCPHCGAPQT